MASGSGEGMRGAVDGDDVRQPSVSAGDDIANIDNVDGVICLKRRFDGVTSGKDGSAHPLAAERALRGRRLSL
jgi:hypothetical protein